MASPLTHEHLARLGDSTLTLLLLGAATGIILVCMFGKTIHKAIVAAWVLLP